MSFALTPPEPVVHVAGDKLGRSYTPPRVADAIMQRLAPASLSTMLEPCVGGGAFVRAFRSAGGEGRVVGCDVDAGAAGGRVVDAFVLGDFRDFRSPELYDFAVTNPPFGAEVGQDVTVGIVSTARKAARVCAMLMPTDYQTQAGFEEHVLELAEIWPVLPRPFPHERGMCVYVWRQGWTRGALFRPLRWRAGRFPNHLGRRS